MGTNFRKIKLEILFMGNHNVGLEVLKALVELNYLVGIVAHPLNHEEGKIYGSVYDFGGEKKIPRIRGNSNDKKVFNFIKKINPNLIILADYKYIIKKNIISIPKLGCYNFHPSILPQYRGRAPLNWAIINNEKEVGLTLHKVDEGIDSGDIVEQVKFTVKKSDYISDILKLIYPLYYELTKIFVKKILFGKIKFKKQNLKNTIIYPARKKEDGEIFKKMKDSEIINMIRAVSKPYPGAFFKYERFKIIIWRAYLSEKKDHYKNNFGDISYLSVKKIKISLHKNYLISDSWEKISN